MIIERNPYAIPDTLGFLAQPPSGLNMPAHDLFSADYIGIPQENNGMYDITSTHLS
jgi:hypothetical protein